MHLLTTSALPRGDDVAELPGRVEEAETLSTRRDVDLHELERLLRAGCNPVTALRIVA